MPALTAVQMALHWLSLLLSVILLVRLFEQRLHRTYKWFFLLWLIDTARTLVLLQVPQMTNRYTEIFFGTMPLLWVLYFLVLREMLEKVMADHRGIASAAAQAMYVALGSAVVISVALAWPELGSRESAKYNMLMSMFIMHRVVMATLLLLLLALGGFLLWFPVRLRRNVVSYSLGFLIYFFGMAVLLLIHNVLAARLSLWLSTAHLVVANLVIGYWILTLNRAGETLAATVGGRWNREQAEEAVRQLEAINNALGRANRKLELPKESTTV